MKRLLSGISALLVTISAAAWSAEPDDLRFRTVTVTGESRQFVAPDHVLIHVGIEATNEDLSAAKNENAAIAEQVSAILAQHGVAPADIQTGYVRIDPRWQEPRQRLGFLGYVVSQTLNITLRDIEAYGPLTSALFAAGLTSLRGAEFRSSELPAIEKKALRAAVADARLAAEAMCKELGQRLGKPRRIVEDTGQPGTRPWSSLASATGRGGEASDLKLEAGRITVHARVTVTFDME